jgi:ferredoxin like protein
MTKKIKDNKREIPKVFVDDMLMSVKYFTDEQELHLSIIDPAVCQACENQPCIDFCPVGAYRPQDGRTVQIAVQSCVECGTCRVLCPYYNVSWKNPRGGFGVSYKFG